LLYFDVTAACVNRRITGNIIRANIAAAGFSVENAFYRIDFQIAGAGAYT